jgi:N-acyl-D-aspartate/D-glutamate deacylase
MPERFDLVIRNGTVIDGTTVVWREGRPTGARPGRVLARAAS